MQDFLAKKALILVSSLVVPFLVTIVLPLLVLLLLEVEIQTYYVIPIIPITVFLSNRMYVRLNQKLEEE